MARGHLPLPSEALIAAMHDCSPGWVRSSGCLRSLGGVYSDGCCAGALSGNGADAGSALEALPVAWFMEVVAMLVPVIAEVLAGLVILWFAVRLRQGRISRDSAVGVRTPSTMRSDAAFETANKAAAPLTGAGGVVMAVCGALGAVFPRHLAGAFIFGGVGVFLVLCLLGAAVGVRAARPVG